MELVLVALVFLAAILLPVYIVHHYRPKAWYWHALAILASLAIGFAPATVFLDTLPGTFVYGFCIGFLMLWGIAGLVVLVSHKEQAPKAG